MLPNQLCVLFKDKANSDLELSCVIEYFCVFCFIVFNYQNIATLPQRYVYKCNL